MLEPGTWMVLGLDDWRGMLELGTWMVLGLGA